MCLRPAGLLAVALFTSALLATGARADTIVVPGAVAGTEGAIEASFPFTETTGRTQQLYSATLFTSQGVTGPISITGMRFRRDGTDPTFGPTVVDLTRIDLSTTSQTPDSLTSTFADNVGADNTTVFGAPGGSPLTLSSPGTGTPNPFDIFIGFTTPFVYDPNQGNFLFDVTTLDGNPALGAFDLAFGLPVGQASLLVNADVLSPVGLLHQNLAFPVQFEFVPVAASTPEPGSLVLFGGALAAGFVRYQRKRKPDAEG